MTSSSRSFRGEHSCRLSSTEEVRVREYAYAPLGPKRELFSLEVLYSGDGGRTWVPLPLRRSPGALVKCVFLQGEWPPQLSQRLSCDKGKIELEFSDLGHWDDTPSRTWRATYDPRWRWWNLEMIGGVRG
jgi:hypothetical protein